MCSTDPGHYSCLIHVEPSAGAGWLAGASAAATARWMLSTVGSLRPLRTIRSLHHHRHQRIAAKARNGNVTRLTVEGNGAMTMRGEVGDGGSC